MDNRPNDRITALVVEQDPFTRDLICLALERAKIEPLTASCSADALRLIHCQPVDLAIIDLLLSPDSGLDLMAQICACMPKHAPPIIALSALGFEHIVLQAIAAGARDFIMKPFSTDLLLERVFRLVSPKIGSPTSPQPTQGHNRRPQSLVRIGPAHA